MTYRTYVDPMGLKTIDVEKYVSDVVVREKRMEGGLVGDRLVLLAALQLAVQAAKFVDLVKKLVVYGKPIQMGDLMKAVDAVICDAEWAFETFHDTEGNVEPLTINPRLLHAALGGYGEQGEMLEVLMGQLKGGGTDIAKIIDEAGDDSWYDALRNDEIAQLLGTSVTDATDKVLVGNTNKLELRHGAKFDPNHAKNRDAEMAAVKEAL